MCVNWQRQENMEYSCSPQSKHAQHSSLPSHYPPPHLTPLITHQHSPPQTPLLAEYAFKPISNEPQTTQLAHQTPHIKPREPKRGQESHREGPDAGGGTESQVGPRLPPLLSNNCNCQGFFLLLSWVLFAAVVGVFSSYISFSSASIALNILQLTESAECNELKDENTKMHNVHPSFFKLQR